ncbi:MAG: type II toxin-antitoxin system MqsR family toxin [Erythrobacter sp.]
MSIKRVPHHDLASIKETFFDADSVEITRKAFCDAQALGYSLEEVCEVIQALEHEDFVKSETAHNPPNHKNWHDTYVIPYDDLWLYLKFAGETLIDLVLASFKEDQSD